MAQEISSEVGDLVELETPPPITADVQSLGKLLRTVNIGSRKSILALIQADLVAGLLKKQNGDLIHFPIHTVMVRGDADKTTPFLQMDKTHGTDAGKNIWTEEMEHMLGTGELDLLVHSLKDLPTALPEKCALGAVIEREDPSDSLVVKPGLSYTSFDQMPDGSVVGTSSTRRKALLKRLYPHLVAKECRGNM
jgi:hydroxymethylbilane synthase